MRFQLFIVLVFFLIPYFSQGQLSFKNQNQVGKQGEKKTEKDDLIKLYKPVEDMVKSGLFVWDRLVWGRSKPKAIRIPVSGHRETTSIWDNMSEKCPDSLDVLDKEIKNYNKLYGDYNLEDSADNVNAFSKGLNDVIIKIQSGVSACVKELREDYIDLNIKFAKPLNQSYLDISSFYNESIHYLDQNFVNFVRNHWSSEGKLFQMRTQVLSYDDFQDRCIASNTGEGINEVYRTFYDDKNNTNLHNRKGWFSIEKSYAKLRDFFSRNDYCWSKMQELAGFADSDLFKEFVSLPQRCRDNDAEIESLKQAVLVVDDENRNTSIPDVLNYCKEELEKTAGVCSCGREDCSGEEGDSVLSKLNAGSKELCGSDSLNKAVDVCLRRANFCSRNCNNRLSKFKKSYKDLFFTSDLSLGAGNIHVHFKTACLADMKEIQSRYEKSVSRKPPYSGVEEVRVSVLSSFKDLGLVCEEPLDSLKAGYNRLEEKCGKKKAAENEDKDKDKAKAKAKGEEGSRALASDKGGSSYGSSSSSQKDRGRYSDRYSGGNVDNEEFSYNSKNRFSDMGGGDVEKLRGFGGSVDKEGFYNKRKGYSDEKNKRAEGKRDKVEKKGSKEFGGESLSGDSAGLGSQVINAPLKALSSIKSKVKKMGVAADKNIRDYLLKDNPSYLRYENGYVMTEEQKERMRSGGGELTGLSGISGNLRKKAYRAYNTMVPISDEEFRKRVGFMRHDVDLFEVNNLLFCRFCLTTIAKSKEQRDKCELPVMGRCGDLETVIKRYNELAEYQLIKPEEKRVIVKQKLERERDRRELAYRGLTREEQLKRISNGLDEAERKAKKVRKSKGMSF